MDVFFLGLAAVFGVAALLLLAWRKDGSGFLAFSFAVLSLMLVLTFTPVLWALAGRPSESYPEFLVLLYGIPAGLCITLVAAVRFWLIWRRTRSPNYSLKRPHL
jgi:hypothetical protein